MTLSVYHPKRVLLSNNRPGPFLFTAPRVANRMIAELLPLVTETHPILCRVYMPQSLSDAVHRYSEALIVAADVMLNSVPINGGPLLSMFPMNLQLSLLVWNTQGAGGTGFLSSLRELIRIHEPKVIALVETRISGRRVDQVCARIGFDGIMRVEAEGFVGHIWLLWKTEEVVINMISRHPQHLTVEIARWGEISWVLSAIYAAPQAARRLELWRELEDFAVTNRRPWLIMGDFNATRTRDERSSCSSNSVQSCRRFSEWIHLLQLVDLGYSGPRFTWTRGKSIQTYQAARLDRALCIDSWRVRFPEAELVHLSAPHSDHLSLLLKLGDTVQKPTTQRPFRFQAAWMLHDQFASFLSSSWNSSSKLTDSLAQFTSEVIEWNKDVFGNVFRRKRRLWARLAGARKKLAASPTPDLIGLQRWLRKELEDVLEQEQVLWFQKSRAQFFVDGDRNTKYYHLSTIIRRKANKISALQRDDGTWVDSSVELSTMVHHFFRTLYTEEGSEEPITEPSLQTDFAFPALSAADCELLAGNFAEKDVWESLKAMSPLKAPGPDGFQAMFFQKHWPLVKNQVCTTVLNLLNEGVLHEGISNSLMVLIPKIDHPERPAQLRPISLLNVVFKIATKAIVHRLKSVLPTVVSPTQPSFIPGRQIVDNIVVVQEVLLMSKFLALVPS